MEGGVGMEGGVTDQEDREQTDRAGGLADQQLLIRDNHIYNTEYN